MLEKIIDNTSEYIDSMPKKNEKIRTIFTSIETARYMAELFEIPQNQDKISLLDAGAGSGILSCAMIERLEHIEGVKKVEVLCYETDENVMPLLQKNLNLAKEFSSKEVEFVIKEDNYILSQYLDFNYMVGGNFNPPKYDIVIGNPPYMKIPKEAPEAKAMPDICYGAPNMYFIFAAMGLFNLKEMVRWYILSQGLGLQEHILRGLEITFCQRESCVIFIFLEAEIRCLIRRMCYKRL